jgi:hypothetical protein
LNSLALISSPFQLLSLGEYSYQTKINKCIIIVLYQSKKELEQINAMSDIYNTQITHYVRGRRLIQYFELKKILKRYKNIDNILLGNFFSEPHIYALDKIKYKDVIVLDDGMVVHKIPDYINTNKNILKKSLLRTIALKAFGINIRFPKKIKLFSIFNIVTNKSIELISNRMLFLNSIMGVLKPSNKIIVIGQPFVELNTLNQVVYCDYLKKIITIYKRDILYFPSRKESLSNINSIGKIKGIKVINSNLNIELYLIKKSFTPKVIIGFTSSALVTLNKLFNNNTSRITITSFKLKFLKNRFNGNFYEKIYEKFTEYGINYKSLNI